MSLTRFPRQLDSLGLSETHLGASWTHWSTTSRTASAIWSLLGAAWLSKPHSKCNLAPLGSSLGASATLKIELSPRRELNSHVSGIFAVQALLDCCFAALQWILGAFWTQLGSSWESLGPLLVAVRPVLARSWQLLGGSWGAPRCPWEALGVDLGMSLANLA